MAALFPVTHSTPCTKALLSRIMPDYDGGVAVGCRLLMHGLNDTFEVRTADHRYILRVYRSGWRTPDDIGYELDLLNHLGRKGFPASVPVLRRDGSYLQELCFPEGKRYAVLFTYAEGKEVYCNKEGEESNAELYGRSAARMHLALEDFASPNLRFPLDMEHLLDEPLTAALSLLGHRPEDAAYLLRLADRLRQAVADLPMEGLERTACFGDFHGGNAHLSDDGILTFFDFDCGGPGWTAYDVGVYRWSAKLGGDEKETRWNAFLKGYTEHRTLEELDLQATTYFVPIRHIWLMGLHAANGFDWGYGWLDDGYLDRFIGFLREWEGRYPGGFGPVQPVD